MVCFPYTMSRFGHEDRGFHAPTGLFEKPSGASALPRQAKGATDQIYRGDEPTQLGVTREYVLEHHAVDQKRRGGPE